MLNASTLPEDFALCARETRDRSLAPIIADFHKSFPDIEYETVPNRAVNAQAIRFVNERRVLLYGGLAYHPLANDDALTFVLLHETGHHCAAGRRFAGDPALACDCLADRWAIRTGAEMLRKASGRLLDVRSALRSIDSILVSMNLRPGRRGRGVQKGGSCWATDWRMRVLRLGRRNCAAPTGPCYFWR